MQTWSVAITPPGSIQPVCSPSYALLSFWQTDSLSITVHLLLENKTRKILGTSRKKDTILITKKTNLLHLLIRIKVKESYLGVLKDKTLENSTFSKNVLQEQGENKDIFIHMKLKQILYHQTAQQNVKGWSRGQREMKHWKLESTRRNCK